MPLIKTQGIVLKQINLGEADKIITLLTQELGKIQTVVHGARKPKSKFLSSTQIFSYSEFVLYKGKSLYTVNQSEVKESFQGLLNDLYTLTYGSYMVELVDVLTQDEEINVDILSILLKTLYLLCDSSIDREFLIRAFELKSMGISGFMPNLSSCSVCRNDSAHITRFSSSLGGVICENCSGHDKYSLKVDASTISIMKYLLYNNMEKIRSIKISKQNLDEMKKIMKNYIKYYLEKDFKSLEFLDSIKHVDNL